jgi:DNA-directed RNA polymerase beta subunit
MTETGTFIINGSERIVLNYFIKSPGIYFEKYFDSKSIIYKASILLSNRTWFNIYLETYNIKKNQYKKNKVKNFNFLKQNKKLKFFIYNTNISSYNNKKKLNLTILNSKKCLNPNVKNKFTFEFPTEFQDLTFNNYTVSLIDIFKFFLKNY